MYVRFFLNRSVLFLLLAAGGLTASSPTLAEYAPATTNSAATGTQDAPVDSLTGGDNPATIGSDYSRNQCMQAGEALYQKSLLIMDFPRIEANSAKPGNLHQVEYWLPELLTQALQDQAGAIAPVHLNGGLAAPDASTDLQLATQVQHLARTHRSQFVLSGEVLDMSMADPDRTYNPALYTRVISNLHDSLRINTFLDKRDRIFSFQLNLRDGFTGQLLFQKRYHTYGAWGIREANVGFATPRFWRSDYGRKVQRLIAHAGDELAGALRCQPYIARADLRAGQQQVVLHSGANNGLRPGDKLELYQLILQPITGEYQLYDTRLVNRNAAVEIQEVYPSHSVAIVHSDNLLYGQFLAVAPY